MHPIPVPAGLPRRLARAWLALGLAAIAGSGVLALLLVMSRTPGLQHAFPWQDFFRAALVVHVDLSVLVWFLACAAVLWTLAGDERLPRLGWAGFGLSAAGTAVMAASPFLGDPQPLLNNYIPVLRQPAFFAGLGLVGAGFACAVLRALATCRPGAADGWGGLRWGVLFSAVAGAAALAALAVSWQRAPDYAGQAYFEALFWGGGHALQFQHALLMLVAWWWLLAELGAAPRLAPRWLAAGFALAALPLVAVPVIYLAAPVGSATHTAQFARLMEAGHPLMLPLLLVAAVAMARTWTVTAPARSALWASALLFAAGGVLGYLIRGANVVIPAHYHGAIVGITLAFMGLAYVLLPRLGGAPVDARLARLQPYIYGGGQLLHVLGLAWSGGYGVQRKVAGTEQVLSTLPQKIGMGMMGLGGLIAVIGGILFVWVCAKSMLGPRQRAMTA